MAIKRHIFFGILLFTFLGIDAKTETKIIVYRGFWNTERTPKNSIAVLTKADNKESDMKYFIEKGTESITTDDPKTNLNLVKQE
jgi:hypothetical protein